MPLKSSSFFKAFIIWNIDDKGSIIEVINLSIVKLSLTDENTAFQEKQIRNLLFKNFQNISFLKEVLQKEPPKEGGIEIVGIVKHIIKDNFECDISISNLEYKLLSIEDTIKYGEMEQ